MAVHVTLRVPQEAAERHRFEHHPALGGDVDGHRLHPDVAEQAAFEKANF